MLDNYNFMSYVISYLLQMGKYKDSDYLLC